MLLLMELPASDHPPRPRPCPPGQYFRRNLEEQKPAPAAAGPPAAGAGAAMAPIPAATSEEATPTAGGDDSGNPVSQAPVIDVG